MTLTHIKLSVYQEDIDKIKKTEESISAFVRKLIHENINTESKGLHNETNKEDL